MILAVDDASTGAVVEIIVATDDTEAMMLAVEDASTEDASTEDAGQAV